MPIQYSRRQTEDYLARQPFPCVRCGEEITSDMLLTCTVCGVEACPGCVDASVLVCAFCLDEEDEEDEEMEREERERGGR